MLDREAGALAKLARRVGQRCRNWLVKYPDVLPDEDWRESYAIYTKAVLGLLREQSARAKLVAQDGAPPVSEEQFADAVKELALSAIAEMPQAELESLLRERTKAKAAPAVVAVVIDVPDEDPK